MGRLNDDETVRRRSGWLIPLSVFGVTFVLSGVLLLFYLAPRGNALFNEQTEPTSRSEPVALTVGGLALHVPANYIIYDSARTGGVRNDIALFALLPDLSGWSNWAADAFANNAEDSDVVYLTIKAKPSLSEADKLKRVWPDYLMDRQGSDGPFGLHHYAFRQDTGYRSEELFVGETASGPVVLRCVKPSPQVPSPSCLRETQLTRGVTLSVRFKRAHLVDWRKITAKADALVTSFRKTPRTQ